MIFTTIIKIRGYHLDAYGHVNNARWVELLEEARWQWLDEDIDLASWDAKGQGIAVVNLMIWVGLFGYMYRLDRKVSRLED